MSFIDESIPAREVPAEGSLESEIMLIGEAPGEMEAKYNKPFCGPAGSVLEQCLHAAGIIRSDCYITNTVKVKPIKNNITPFYSEKTGFSDRGQEYVRRLKEEIEASNCEVIVTLGNVATAALLGKRSITKVRGYIYEFEGIPVIPTIHPSAVLRGNYIHRYYIMHDLKKAKEISDKGLHKDIIHLNIFSPGNGDEIELDDNISYEMIDLPILHMHLHEIMTTADKICFDIEVKNYEVDCISMSTGSLNLVIDLCNSGIHIDQEIELWSMIATILENPNIAKIGQNLIFDIYFLLYKNGIHTKGKIIDTMIAHSIMYPDFEKSLSFLGSVYCNIAPWKDMVKFDNIKKES